jgi:pimeloyl-ACP methyl ester carboxylesterase
MQIAARVRTLLTLLSLLLFTTALHAAQTPYAELDVTIPAASGITLDGTLTALQVPGGKLPAILLISGAGPHDRDETAAGHKPFLLLADFLTRRGMVVLRVDDRGTGKSTGKFDTASTADFAGDADAELQYLRSRPEVDSARVGVLGHGEGATIAAMLVAKDPKIAFAILLACPAVPGLDVLVAQTSEAETASGLPEEQIQADADIGSTLYKLAAQGKSANELESALKKASRGIPPAIVQSWKAQIPRLTSPWLRFFLTYNPSTALEHVSCPVLALYGERDLQVIPDQNAPELERALKRAHNREVTIRLLPQLNYMFQRSRTGLAWEYSAIPEDMSSVALNEIGRWLAKFAAPSGAGKPSSSGS